MTIEAVPLRARTDVALPHGYTVAQVDQLVRTVVAGSPFRLDRGDLYEAAWFVMVEVLYEAESRPYPGQLVNYAGRVVPGLILENRKDQGCGAAMYWGDQLAPAHGPEDRIVDRVALWQVWAQLTPLRQQAVLALIEHGGEHQAAAAALGVGYQTFVTRLDRARRAFRALWHEGETPSASWQIKGHQTEAFKAARRRQQVWRHSPFWQRQHAAKQAAAGKEAIPAA